jgi:citrate lyase beta subunit
LPKVEHPNDVHFVQRFIDMTLSGHPIPSTSSPGDGSYGNIGSIGNNHTHNRRRRPISILAAIESASGLMNLSQIASTSVQRNNTSLTSHSQHSHLAGLIFASEDYCADLGLTRTTDAKELLHARSSIVTAAKAYGLDAIDMVHIDFRNLQDLQRECDDGRVMGFTGKQAIHPTQVEVINDCFGSASAQDLVFASRVVEEYEHVVLMVKPRQDEGCGGTKATVDREASNNASTIDGATTAVAGACVVDGIVVDAPVYKWALKVLGRK